MKKILLSMALLFSLSMAEESAVKLMPEVSDKKVAQVKEAIAWERDFNTAAMRAEKEKKPVILVVSKRSCKWCYHYKENALLDPLVVKAINRDFVALMIEMEDGGLPEDLWTPGTPATWFLGHKAQPMFQPLMGSQPSEQLLNAFSIVTKEYAQVAVKK